MAKAKVPVDGFEFDASHPYAKEHQVISDFLEEICEYHRTREGKDPRDGKLMGNHNPEQLNRYIIALAQRSKCLAVRKGAMVWKEISPSYELSKLLDRKPELGEAEFVALCDYYAHEPKCAWSLSSIVKKLVKFCGGTVTDARFLPALQVAHDYFKNETTVAAQRKCAELAALLNGGRPKVPITPGEAWADAALKDLAAMTADDQTAWSKMLQHCLDATSPDPTAKWIAKAETLLEAIGKAEFKKVFLRWQPIVAKPAKKPIMNLWHPSKLTITHNNQGVLRGLAWTASLISGDKAIAAALNDLALIAFKQDDEYGPGPRALRVGTGSVWGLGNIGMIGAGYLTVLKKKIRFSNAKKAIDKALDAAARNQGTSREAIEEVSVQTHGLDAAGSLEVKVGDATARLQVNGSAVELTWLDAAGKPMKSAPKGDKKNLQNVKALKQEISKSLAAQRERLDGLALQSRRIPYDEWRKRYADNPLVGSMSRRLIWCFHLDGKTTDGIFVGEKILDVTGKPVAGAKPGAEVEIWHPLGRPAAEVEAWRRRVEALQVSQPFKQAHREIYVLTAAERTTRTYSNRFAAHLLKQYQFQALCAARNWRFKVDNYSDQPARRELPQHKLRAEYWVNSPGHGHDFLTTDQVRFYEIAPGPKKRNAAAEPLPLESIPPMVFSEVMRDVDLFVGVCSVGNNPNWGADTREYWHGYSFGALGETAKTRKAALEKLVPRLKIAKQVTFEERFLVVKGSLRSYKIHLGSGNILMTPNDEYLCIVANPATDARVYLPFEGDNVLSVILSKAMMLAEDGKIRDATIVSQIRR